jgi:hypothetical protein
MCPTPIGRIHSRVAALTLPALLATSISLLTGNPGWIVLIGVYLLLGVSLDAGVYSWLLKYQPPWMTGVLALWEYGLLLVLANVLDLPLSVAKASLLYWVSWLLATATRIVLFPIFSLTYLESSAEFRRIEWSIPPAQASLPIVASAADAAAGPGELVRSASGVHAAPLEPKPSPSGVRPAVSGQEPDGRSS